MKGMADMEDLGKLERQLAKCGYLVRIFENSTQVIREISRITKAKKVGFGSSQTVAEIGLIDEIRPSAAALFLHEPGQAGESERNALASDMYITSANALSMNGEIVNIDGTGNRVGATCFGPREVIYIIGENKIVDNLDSALHRAKETAIKLAAKHKRNTPCVRTGRCSHCYSAECVCSITTIHRKQPFGVKVRVFVVKEHLGL